MSENDVDALANLIRTVDGSNALGAGALAEQIVAHGWLRVTPAPRAGAASEALERVVGLLLRAPLDYPDVGMTPESARSLAERILAALPGDGAGEEPPFCVCRHHDAVACAQSRDIEPHHWPAEACTCACHDESANRAPDA